MTRKSTPNPWLMSSTPQPRATALRQPTLLRAFLVPFPARQRTPDIASRARWFGIPEPSSRPRPCHPASSAQVATYDLQPEMSAPELTDRAVGAIKSGQYDLIILNYANP